ncbi:MAG TPA: hypothetical protein VFV38_09360 [Ktedonobacteraceae bacterium]|nr:hypothetical protein [Ktedonobacteraceae bacterium]
MQELDSRARPYVEALIATLKQEGSLTQPLVEAAFRAAGSRSPKCWPGSESATRPTSPSIGILPSMMPMFCRNIRPRPYRKCSVH